MSDDDGEEHEEHRDAVDAWTEKPKNPRLKGSLGEALYSVSELGLWPDDVDSVSEDQALLCWRIVERLRSEQFPDDLRM